MPSFPNAPPARGAHQQATRVADVFDWMPSDSKSDAHHARVGEQTRSLLSNNLAQKGLAFRSDWSVTLLLGGCYAPRDHAPSANWPRRGFGGGGGFCRKTGRDPDDQA